LILSVLSLAETSLMIIDGGGLDLSHDSVGSEDFEVKVTVRKLYKVLYSFEFLTVNADCIPKVSETKLS